MSTAVSNLLLQENRTKMLPLTW